MKTKGGVDAALGKAKDGQRRALSGRQFDETLNKGHEDQGARTHLRKDRDLQRLGKLELTNHSVASRELPLPSASLPDAKLVKEDGIAALENCAR